MTIYSRYFRVTSGPLMTKALEIEAANKVARKAIADFCKEVGAQDAACYHDGRFAGFEFAKTPDQGVWKQPNSFGHYWPRKNSAAGREMLARIGALPRIVSTNAALEVVGLLPDVPALTHENRWAWPKLNGVAELGVLFVGVPWRDADPAEIAAYRFDRAAGKRSSLSLDHLCWTPSPDMVEIKRWEVEREIEELNAKIKARNAMAAALRTVAEVQP